MSSPIVIGDLLVLTAFENDKLYTIAYRRADGKEAWRAEAPATKLERYHKTEGSPAASTPATDGQRITIQHNDSRDRMRRLARDLDCDRGAE